MSSRRWWEDRVLMHGTRVVVVDDSNPRVTACPVGWTGTIVDVWPTSGGDGSPDCSVLLDSGPIEGRNPYVLTASRLEPLDR
jgi:hypothetical protein